MSIFFTLYAGLFDSSILYQPSSHLLASDMSLQSVMSIPNTIRDIIYTRPKQQTTFIYRWNMYKSVYLLFDVFLPVFCLEMILETGFGIC